MEFILEGIALILVNTFTVWVISGGIFGYAIFSLLRSRKKLALCQDSVDAAIHLIKNHNNPEELYTEYEQVNSALESNPILSQPWREFNKTILKPEAPGDKQILHSPFPASHYFTTDRLLQNSIALHFYHALPNYLTGAGILGTFVGLAAGIYLAQEGLSNPELVLKALQLLLDGASLSFVTSIAGLLGSIVFAVGFKNDLHKFDNNRAKLVDILDANIEFLSLEQLNKQELDLSRQRTNSLDTFFNQIAFNLTESIQNALDTALKEPLLGALRGLTSSIDDMKKAIDDMKNAQGKMNEDMLKGIVSQFSAAISGSAGEDMKGFSKSIQQVNKQLASVINALQQQQSAFHENSEHSAKAISDSFVDGSRQLQQTMLELMGGLNEKNDSITKLIEKSATDYEKSSSMFSGSAIEMQSVFQGAKEILTSFKEIAMASKQNLTEIAQISSNIEKTSSTLEQVSHQNAGFVQAMQSSLQEMKSSHDHLLEMQSSTEAAWKEYQKRFEGVDASLGNIFRQLNDGMQQYSNLYKEYLLEMDKHTSGITETLASAVMELGESIDEMNDALNRPKK